MGLLRLNKTLIILSQHPTDSEMSNAAASQYFIVFALVRRAYDYRIQFRDHAIIYVELKSRATFADIRQEVHKMYKSHVIITGYNEITRDEYAAGLLVQQEEAKNNQYPPGDCVIL